MSFCAIKWSYTSPDVLKAGLKRSDLAVLRALCWVFVDKNRTPRDPNCYPSVATLARLTGLKSSAINEAKSRLLKKGLISWQRAANFNDAQLATNCYAINCPALQNTLKENEARIRSSHEVPTKNEEDDFRISALSPGKFYMRPDPTSLVSAFSTPLTTEESNWMADALAFVCDRPENRKALFGALRKSADLATFRKTLARVVRTSQTGRKITNRIGYLLKALRTGNTPHTPTPQRSSKRYHEE